MRLKVASIVGARPQFIKASALSVALRVSPNFEERIVHTGQHYDPEMSDVFFEQMQIPRPDYRLEIGSGTHAYQTAAALTGIETVLSKEKPHIVVVFGDTNTTLAGALAAVKMHITIAHVEAGMRSFNRKMPEEINRIVTDHVADLHFCASKTAVENLAAEGIRAGVFLVGDIMADCVRIFGAAAEKRIDVESRFGVKRKEFALLTCHRAENTDNIENLEGIMRGVSRVAMEMPVVFPAHPRVRKALQGLKLHERVFMIPPVGYLEMLALERAAKIVLTDSGGVQKEALYARVPCVTLRNETEWVETVEAGWNVLVGTDDDKIVEAVNRFLDMDLSALPDVSNIYGDGHTAEKIVEILCQQIT